MEIRVFVKADTDAVIDLWNLADLTHPNNDPSLDIKRKMNDSPWGFLVAIGWDNNHRVNNGRIRRPPWLDQLLGMPSESSAAWRCQVTHE